MVKLSPGIQGEAKSLCSASNLIVLAYYCLSQNAFNLWYYSRVSQAKWLYVYIYEVGIRKWEMVSIVYSSIYTLIMLSL